MKNVYRVITADSPLEMIQEIERLMGHGWRPQGGICLSWPEDNTPDYAQALIHPENVKIGEHDPDKKSDGTELDYDDYLDYYD